MPTTNNLIYEATLVAGGGTINLPVTDPYTKYVFDGSATLSSSYTIQSSGTPSLGTEFIIQYNASLILNSNTLTIFGADIIADLALKHFIVHAIYNGSSWDTTVLANFGDQPFITGDMIDFQTIVSGNIANDAVTTVTVLNSAITAAKLASDSVSTVKILNNNITLEKLETDLLKEVIHIPVSFETGEQSENTITIPFDCTIDSIRYTVTKAIAATDAATITPTISGIGTTPSSISIPLSTVINTSTLTTITASNNVTAGDLLRFTSAKTTAGGKALLTINITRR